MMTLRTRLLLAGETKAQAIAADDAEDRLTIIMMPVWNWSDGTPGPVFWR